MLMGSIIGDYVGSVYELHNTNRVDFTLISKWSRFTDDTVLTVATAEALMGDLDFRSSYQKWGLRHHDYGYGGGFRKWLGKGDKASPYGSYGNGSAMRVSPVGWVCESLEQTRWLAKRSAAVTHSHPEGIAGAEAVAVGVFLYRSGASDDEVKVQVARISRFSFNKSIAQHRGIRGFRTRCRDTVPVAFAAVFEASDFTEAVRLAVSAGGDSDTIASMAGGLAEAKWGLPMVLEEKVMSELPEDMRAVVELFNRDITTTREIIGEIWEDHRLPEGCFEIKGEVVVFRDRHEGTHNSPDRAITSGTAGLERPATSQNGGHDLTTTQRLVPAHVLDTILKSNDCITKLTVLPNKNVHYGALDIVNYSELQELDLSQLSDNLKLRVDGCDKLRVISLPADQKIGATLHIAAGTTPSIEVSGTIRWLDTAWANGDEPERAASLPISPNKMRSFENAYIGAAQGDTSDVDLVIINQFDGVESLCVDGHEVAVVGGDKLTSITASAGVLNLLVSECKGLRDIELEGDVEKLHLRHLGNLQRVSGNGVYIRHHGGRGAPLKVAGLWRNIHFSTSHVGGINAVGTLSLTAINSRIEPIECTGEVKLDGVDTQNDDELNQHVLEQYSAMITGMSGEGRKNIIANIKHVRGGAETRRALEVLYQALLTGMAPKDVWEARMELRKHNMVRASRRDPRHLWGWQMSRDLGYLGWQADFKIWLTCIRAGVAQLPTTLQFNLINYPVHLRTMAALMSDDEYKVEATDWLRRALTRGVKSASAITGVRQKDMNLNNHTTIGPTRRQITDTRKVIELLARRRKEEDTAPLVTLLTHWIKARMPYKVGADVLGAMVRLGNEEAKRRLMEWVADPKTEPELKSHALVLFMTKPRSSLLSFEVEAEGEGCRVDNISIETTGGASR